MESTIVASLVCPVCRATYHDLGTVFCTHDGARLRPVDDREALWLGRTVAGKYRPLRLLGIGGMAEVYEAEDLEFDRRVALKVLRPRLAADPTIVERFKQEARLVSLIAHPNVVKIEAFGALPDDTLYMVMELLHGETAADALRRGALGATHALEVAVQACRGLADAHERGVIHRDIKPANLFLHDGGAGTGMVVKVLDLGIATLLDQDQSNLSTTGSVFGTPEYMSPEQALGEPVGPASDVYSLGVTLYHMLLGRRPFFAPSFMGVLAKHITEKPRWPDELARSRGVPVGAEAIVLKALAKHPGHRYGSMQELGAALATLHQSVTMPSLKAPMVHIVTSDLEPTRPPVAMACVPLEGASGGDGEVVELAPGVYWVGRRHGVALECNAYLRVYRREGTQVALLVDPGPPKDQRVIAAKVAAVIGSLARVDLVFLNHQDPDVASNAAIVQELNPRAHVLCSADTWRLVQFYGLNPQNHSAVEDFRGGEMRLGTGHSVSFVSTPYCHFRGAVMLYDRESRVLFTGDLLGGVSVSGAMVATEKDWPGVEIFHQLYMPSCRALEAAMQRIQALDPPPLVIAPQHGGILVGERVAAWTARLRQILVGADMVVDDDEKNRYLAALHELVGELTRWLGEAATAALLRRDSADGSFPSLFVFEDARAVVDFKIQPRAALTSLREHARAVLGAPDRSGLDRLFRETLERHGLDDANRAGE
jgi:glyoxylase-like metal-dependent hydrolase (beta-lactamase superfamily II)/tRNA A-37 threonylcarbamoyl transferase component Bud32